MQRASKNGSDDTSAAKAVYQFQLRHRASVGIDLSTSAATSAVVPATQQSESLSPAARPTSNN